MRWTVDLLLLGLACTVLAALATWVLPLAFPLALSLVLAGLLARDFVAISGTTALPARTGAAATAIGGIALTARAVSGIAALALMLAGALWMLHPGT